MTYKASNFFHLFSGEDREIIRAMNDKRINNYFNIIGFSVIAICIICFISALTFMLNILEGYAKIASLPIGFFWGFTVTIIYVLLLYTITPPLLLDKHSLKNKSKKKKTILSIKENSKDEKHNVLSKWFSISMIVRLTFIGVFAFIIAQPFNVILFSPLIKEKLELYKAHYKAEIILNADEPKIQQEILLRDEFFSKIHLNTLPKEDSLQISKLLNGINEKTEYDFRFLNNAKSLKKRISQGHAKKIPENDIENLIIQLDKNILAVLENDEMYLSSNPITENAFEINRLDDEFRKLIKDKAASNNYIISLIDKNNFYMRKIILINSSILGAFFVNIFFVLLFVVPIFQKFSIRSIRTKDKMGFYDYKEKYERNFVVGRYKFFKQNFEKQFHSRQLSHYLEMKKKINEKLSEFQAIGINSKFNYEKELIERFYPYVEQSKEELIEKFGFSIKQLEYIEERNKIEFYEKYVDPPFNLQEKKTERVILSGQVLIDSVWNKNE